MRRILIAPVLFVIAACSGSGTSLPTPPVNPPTTSDLSSLSKLSLPTGDSHCPTGGVQLTLNGGTVEYVCDGAVGPTGPSGPTGPGGGVGGIGPIGPAGPVGPAGPQGLQGLQGPQGVKGDAGAQGPASAPRVVVKTARGEVLGTLIQLDSSIRPYTWTVYVSALGAPTNVSTAGVSVKLPDVIYEGLDCTGTYHLGISRGDPFVWAGPASTLWVAGSGADFTIYGQSGQSGLGSGCWNYGSTVSITVSPVRQVMDSRYPYQGPLTLAEE